MSQLPLVSIITPTFNIIDGQRKQSLIRCFRSIRYQNYPHIEHIVVDGGSSDGTVKILKKYAAKGWIRFISKKDHGIFDGMNRGISLAKGKYIAFLNSDDHYHQLDGIQKTVEKLEESRADFSYAPAIIKFNENSIFSDHPHNRPVISHVFFTMPFCHQTMFTKKTVLVKEGKFNTVYKSASDYDLVYRLCLKKYKSVFVPHTFVTYFFSGKSSINQKLSISEMIEIFQSNLSSFHPISLKTATEMAKDVYTGNFYRCFPYKIALKLQNHSPYFDYQDYLAKTGRVPQLSIITVTFNDKNFSQNLKSVLSQNIAPNRIEHIIIDNLSTNTPKLVKKYIKQAPYKVTYIREKDRGRFDAMNKGIKHARGVYLSFMNGDNHFFDRHSVATVLDQSHNQDIIYGDLEVIDGRKRTIYSPPDQVDFKYFRAHALPHQASIIKADLFKKVGLYDDTTKIVGDWKFFLLAICKFNCSYLHLKTPIASFSLDGISSDPKYARLNYQEKRLVYQEHFCSISTKKVIAPTPISSFSVPILFNIFNRPAPALQVFRAIQKIRPRHLYVAADGPRLDHPGEDALCQQTRHIIQKVDWPCTVHTLYRQQNLGCGQAISQAVSWFFDEVKEGIILEDDCLPNPSFFTYCKDLLKKYRHNRKIMHISGDQFIPNDPRPESYYFTKNMHCWGWASWADRWQQHYSFNPSIFNPQIFKNLSSNPQVINYWRQILSLLQSGQIDTWDYQWAFSIISQNGLCINPTRNLISNIGFGNGSTHTLDSTNPLANLPTFPLTQIIHPSKIAVDQQAVNYIFEHHFGINLHSHPTLRFPPFLSKLKTFIKFIV